MPRTPFRRLAWLGLALAGALTTVGGCRADPLAATARDASVPRHAVATSGVFTTQLRAFPGTTPYAWGNLQLTVGGTAADPCGGSVTATAPGSTTIALCGRLFNQGGATFTGGGLYRRSSVELDASLLLVAPFPNGAHPPSPCRRYDVQGTLTVGSDVAADILASPADYLVLFEGLEPPPDPAFPPGPPVRLLGGSLDGQAWGPVGSIASTDVFYMQNVCTVQFAPTS